MPLALEPRTNLTMSKKKNARTERRAMAIKAVTNPGGFPMFAGLRNQVKLVTIPMNTPTMMEPTKTRTATNEAITNTTAFMNIWIPRAIVETKRAIWQPVFSNGFPAQAGWAVE